MTRAQCYRIAPEQFGANADCRAQHGSQFNSKVVAKVEQREYIGAHPGSELPDRILARRKLGAARNGDDMTELRFVLLEDDPADAELIQGELSKSDLRIHWTHAVSEADFSRALDAPVDL